MLFSMAGRLTSGTLICLLVFCVCAVTLAGSCTQYDDLIDNGGYGLLNLKQQGVRGCNLDALYVPASVIKVATAYTALRILGPDYRFQTQVYLDAQHNLYIKGFGDPFLVSEFVDKGIEQFAALGVSTVHNLFIDDTAYALEHIPPGSELSDNPYDAPVGAAAVNFNSVAFVVDAGGQVRSGEPQTPFLPIMQEKAQGRKPGAYRVNICSSPEQQQVEPARYTAQLFQSLFSKHKIEFTGIPGRRPVPDDARLLCVLFSEKRLEDMLVSMLHYSSNYIANQIFLACGARLYGLPATWEKAARAEREILGRVFGQESAQSWKIYDGAGLSRENRLSIRATLTLLESFFPYHHLLKKRDSVFVKSGTMEGIYNYAGYLNDHTAFVIYLNQPNNGRRKVLRRLIRMQGEKGS